MFRQAVFFICVCLSIFVSPVYAEHPLAGRYFQGDGLLRFEILLHSDGTYTHEWRGDQLLAFGIKQGAWRIDDDELILGAATTSKARNFGSFESRYQVVKWSDRIYLIPSYRLIDFANDVNDGSEPRNEQLGWFFLREDDWNIPVTGKPELPSEYLKYLLDSPVQAKIVEITNEGLIKIDAGTNQGVFVEMVLYVQGEEYTSHDVVSVEADSALCKTRWDKPKVGEEISTLKPTQSQ